MPQVIALVDDLMFLSRIREAARAAGVEVRPVRGASELLDAVRQEGRLVLVDADSERLPWQAAVAALRAEHPPGELRVIAFVSHERADRAEAARSAGATRVLARRAFVQQLPELVAQAAAKRLEEPIP
jgi:DNA-binding NtrC family response regulator